MIDYLGQFGSNPEEVLVPIMAMFFVFGTPMIAMLLHHQRKMAETLRGDRSQNDQIAQLQHQVNQLAQLVHQQTISIDDLRSRSDLGSSLKPPTVTERLTASNEP